MAVTAAAAAIGDLVAAASGPVLKPPRIRPGASTSTAMIGWNARGLDPGRARAGDIGLLVGPSTMTFER